MLSRSSAAAATNTSSAKACATRKTDAAPDTRTATTRQVFLLEPDTGTVCRILSLYAARGLALNQVRLDHAAPLTLMLVVHAVGSAECLRILVDKARAMPGVIEAAGE